MATGGALQLGNMGCISILKMLRVQCHSSCSGEQRCFGGTRMGQASGGLFFVRGKSPLPSWSHLQLAACPRCSLSWEQQGEGRYVCRVRLKAERELAASPELLHRRRWGQEHEVITLQGEVFFLQCVGSSSRKRDFFAGREKKQQ